MPTFDEDTALRPAGDGRLGRRDRRRLGDAARAARRLRDGAGPARVRAGRRRPGALGALGDDALPACPEAGPVEVSATVERAGPLAHHGQRTPGAGRQAARPRARRLLDALGEPAARRRADAGGRAAGRAASRAERPRVPRATRPPFTRRLTMQHRFGAAAVQRRRARRVGGWLGLREERAVDALAIAVLADAWFPAPWPRLTALAPAPTIDLTIHFRAPLPLPDTLLLGRFSNRARPRRLLRRGRRAVDARRDARRPVAPARRCCWGPRPSCAAWSRAVPVVAGCGVAVDGSEGVEGAGCARVGGLPCGRACPFGLIRRGRCTVTAAVRLQGAKPQSPRRRPRQQRNSATYRNVIRTPDRIPLPYPASGGRRTSAQRHAALPARILPARVELLDAPLGVLVPSARPLGARRVGPERRIGELLLELPERGLGLLDLALEPLRVRGGRAGPGPAAAGLAAAGGVGRLRGRRRFVALGVSRPVLGPAARVVAERPVLERERPCPDRLEQRAVVGDQEQRPLVRATARPRAPRGSRRRDGWSARRGSAGSRSSRRGSQGRAAAPRRRRGRSTRLRPRRRPRTGSCRATPASSPRESPVAR